MSVENKIEDMIKIMQTFENITQNTTYQEEVSILNEIFQKPDFTNLFLNSPNLTGVLFNYINTLKISEFYEVFDYLIKVNPELINLYNIHKFNNGKFTELKLNEMNKEKGQKEMLNTVLILNKQPTTNKKFNELFDKIKSFDLNSFDFSNTFNKILLNNIQNGYEFNFMNNFININDIQGKTTPLNKSISFKDLNIMENYILKYNDNSRVFKIWFYMLLNYITNKKLTFDELLNIFLNANIIFYNKLIFPNSEISKLITYIYFKGDGGYYIPNLRYTVDIPGDTHKDKIGYISTYVKSNEDIGFDTNIILDEKGIYFSTTNYDIEKIKHTSEEYISSSKYEELIYYLFRSQFLNRSTCLFTYYIYYYYTHKILMNTHYFDIIALTRNLNDFKKIIENCDNYITHTFKGIETLTLSDFVEFIV